MLRQIDQERALSAPLLVGGSYISFSPPSLPSSPPPLETYFSEQDKRDVEILANLKLELAELDSVPATMQGAATRDEPGN
jgi:hypothetical protein